MIVSDFKKVMNAINDSQENYVMIYPNNDPGADIIIEEMELYRNDPRFRIFSSVRFEYFLVLLKNCKFIVGNSSAGIREAPIYSVPSINIGNRQKNRFSCDTIINVQESKEEILDAIKRVKRIKRVSSKHFGDGKSTERFVNTLKSPGIWNIELQKHFIDTE